MKRLLSYIALVVILTTVLSSSMAEMGNSYILDAREERGVYTDIAVYNDLLYAYRSNDGIYRYQVGNPQPELILRYNDLLSTGQPLENAADHQLLLIGGELLYALVDNVLWQYDTKENAFIRLWQTKLEHQDNYGELLDYTVVDGILYGICLNLHSGATDLVKVDVDSNSIVQVRSNVARFVSYKPGELLVLVRGDSTDDSLEVLNLRKGTIDFKMNFSDESSWHLSYASDTDTVYLWDDLSIRLVKHFSSFETVTYLSPFQSLPQEIVALTEDWIAVNYGNCIYIVKADPVQNMHRPLRVVGFSDDLPNREFMIKYPNIPLELDSHYTESTERLLADIASGGGADVYVLESGVHDVQLMARKGYLTNLTEDPALSEAVLKMYPFVQEVAAPNGLVVALPCSFGPTWRLMGFSPLAFNMIGLTEADVPKSYTDLLLFIEKWQNELESQYQDFTLFGSTQPKAIRNLLIWGIINSEFIFCAQQGEMLLLNPERIAPLLDQVNRIDWGNEQSTLLLDSDTDMSRTLFSNYNLNMGMIDHYLKIGLKPMPLALTPDIPPVTDIRLDMLVVNPNSPNRDAAFLYLHTVLEHLTPEVKASLMPDYNEPVENPSYLEESTAISSLITECETRMSEATSTIQKELEQQIEMYRYELECLKDSQYLLSSNAIRVFREYDYLLHFVPSNPLTNHTNLEINNLVNSFFDKQISTMQFINEVNRKLTMMQMED